MKRVVPWCPGLFLSCLALPFVCAGGLFFFGLGLLGLLLCPCVLLACSGRGRRVPAPGWEGRRVSFLFLFCLMGTDPSTGFSRYPFMYVLLEFHFVLELVFLVSSTGFLLLHHCGHRSLCQRALLGFHKGLRGYYFLSGVADACPMLTLLVTGRVSQYVLRDYRHLDHDQRDLGGKPCIFFSGVGAWRIPVSSIGQDGLLEEDSVAIFVVLPIYNEDEPMFRDTLRTGALVFTAEADPFCAMQARFEFDLAGSEDLVVNNKPQMAPSVFPALNT